MNILLGLATEVTGWVGRWVGSENGWIDHLSSLVVDEGDSLLSMLRLAVGSEARLKEPMPSGTSGGSTTSLCGSRYIPLVI